MSFQICRLSSVMLVIIFFFCVGLYLVSSDQHILITTYTGIRGNTSAETPEFFAVTTLDDQQIDYYDSKDEKLIPRQEWMKKYSSDHRDLWEEDTEIRKHVHQIYRDNIAALMKRFNQTDGIRVYQRMYGCQWDNETGETRGFDQYGYDGEDFIILLDIPRYTSLYYEIRYITPVQQGLITVNKWNKNREQLQLLKHYYNHECIEWMKYILNLRKAVEGKAPEVFLFQKTESSPVICQATGFYPSGITITWFRDEEEYYEDVDLGETLPNEDGTFQKTSILYINPDEWKNSQYICEVRHMGKTIREILSREGIRSNGSLSPFGIILLCIASITVVAVATLIVYWKKRNRDQEMKG